MREQSFSRSACLSQRKDLVLDPYFEAHNVAHYEEIVAAVFKYIDMLKERNLLGLQA
jgi:hypothetical protein